MILIDVSHPRGTLTNEERELLTHRVLDPVLSVEGAPEETMRRARTMTHVSFHEASDWFTGEGRPGAGSAPPMIITLTVPEAWRDDKLARHMTGTVRAAVHRLDAGRGQRRESGDLWVNVVGVQDGCIGLDGRATTGDGVLAHMTEGYRSAVAAGTAPPAPEGKLVDPVCGMLVTPGKGAITIDHHGSTVGFCAPACRDVYRREHSLT